MLALLAGATTAAGCGEAGVGDPAAGGAAVAKVSATAGGGGGGGAASPHVATPGANSGGGAAPIGGADGGGGHAGGGGAGSPVGTGVAHEVADPEEAKSFPLPASVRHRSASSPSAAAEAVVAPGAPSDAQVRRELSEEERAKAQERAAQRRVLTPVAGGFSVGGNGAIPIPANVPEVVQRVVAGGNAIADFPYIWGGGHASFIANGYDCSGSVSYALAAGGLLAAPLVSGELASWGEPGPGRWITIYANAGHTFMSVDGAWFDTAGRSGPYASRWLVSTPPLAGYAVRHPPGL